MDFNQILIVASPGDRQAFYFLPFGDDIFLNYKLFLLSQELIVLILIYSKITGLLISELFLVRLHFMGVKVNVKILKLILGTSLRDFVLLPIFVCRDLFVPPLIEEYRQDSEIVPAD